MTIPENQNDFKLVTAKKSPLRQMFVPLILTLIGVIVVLFAIRWSVHTQSDSHAGNAGAHPDHSMVLQEGIVFPDLELKTLEKKPIHISELLQKNKVLLINFWATWCGPCIEEMPSLIRLSDQYKSDGLKVIGINVDENPEEVLGDAIEKLKIQFPMFVDFDSKISENYHVNTLPTTIVLNQDRKIIFMTTGDEDWMEDSIQNQFRNWLK